MPYEFSVDSMRDLNTHYDVFPDFSDVYLPIAQYEETDRAKPGPFKVKLYDATGEREVLVHGKTVLMSPVRAYERGAIDSPLFMWQVFERMRNGELLYNPTFMKDEPKLVIEDFDFHFHPLPPKNGRKDKDQTLLELFPAWKPSLIRA